MPGVQDQISWIVIGYAALVAVLTVVAALRWRARPPWLGSMVWMLEFLLAVRAVAGLGAIASGDRPDSMATHVGYLLASVAVLPIAMRSVEGDEGPWSLGVIGIAVVAVGVIAARTMVTR